MSGGGDEPSDEALDANASAGIGPVRHAPRLASPDDDAGNSRTVNLGDMREELRAEREMRATREDAPTPSPASRRLGEIRDELSRRRSNIGRALAPPPMPNLGPYRSPLAPQAPRVGNEQDAWDRYVIGALPLVVGLGLEDSEGYAAQIADRLLEERRRRFG